MALLKICVRACLCIISFITFLENVFAGTTALPWEKPLMMIIHSLTGHTAKDIAIISMFVAGGLLVFGGELEDFARRMTWLIMALALMFAGEHVLEVFNKSWAIGVGAVI